jgi:hypothetical protein
MKIHTKKSVGNLFLSAVVCGFLSLACQQSMAQVKTPGTAPGGTGPGFADGYVSQILIRSYGVHISFVDVSLTIGQGISMSCFSDQAGGGKFLPVVFASDPQYQTILASLRDALLTRSQIRIYSDGCYLGSPSNSNFQWPYIAALDVRRGF